MVGSSGWRIRLTEEELLDEASLIAEWVVSDEDVLFESDR